jgi:hypothetical protein
MLHLKLTHVRSSELNRESLAKWGRTRRCDPALFNPGKGTLLAKCHCSDYQGWEGR